MTTILPISMFYLSLVSLLSLVLAYRVVMIRGAKKIGLGDGGDESLTRQIRVHGNLLENFLPFAILFLLAELNALPPTFLHAVGALFLIARLFHAYGLAQSAGRTFGRFYGTVLTWLTLATLIVVNLYHSFALAFT